MSNLELTALVAMAAAVFVSFVIVAVLSVALHRQKRKVKELSREVEKEKFGWFQERAVRRNSETELSKAIAERDHRIKVLEGTVASQRKNIADLRDSTRSKALDSAFTRGGTTEEIVAAAKKFERYLRGKE